MWTHNCSVLSVRIFNNWIFFVDAFARKPVEFNKKKKKTNRKKRKKAKRKVTTLPHHSSKVHSQTHKKSTHSELNSGKVTDFYSSTTKMTGYVKCCASSDLFCKKNLNIKYFWKEKKNFLKIGWIFGTENRINVK